MVKCKLQVFIIFFMAVLLLSFIGTFAQENIKIVLLDKIEQNLGYSSCKHTISFFVRDSVTNRILNQNELTDFQFQAYSISRKGTDEKIIPTDREYLDDNDSIIIEAVNWFQQDSISICQVTFENHKSDSLYYFKIFAYEGETIISRSQQIGYIRSGFDPVFAGFFSNLIGEETKAGPIESFRQADTTGKVIFIVIVLLFILGLEFSRRSLKLRSLNSQEIQLVPMDDIITAWKNLADKDTELRLKNGNEWDEEAKNLYKTVTEQLNKAPKNHDGEDYPVVKIFRGGIENHYNNQTQDNASEEIDRVMKDLANYEFDCLKPASFNWIWNLAVAEPAIGLFGTVYGIALAFGKLPEAMAGSEGLSAAQVLGPEINLALWTTILGLAFGLVLTFIFYYLQDFTKTILLRWRKNFVDISRKI